MTVCARLFLPALVSIALLGACESMPAKVKPAIPEGGQAAAPVAAPAKPDAAEDKEAQQKALDKKKFELECKRLEARIERLGNESATRSAKNEVDSSEFERGQAQRELENFQKAVKPNELDEGQLDIERSTQRLKEQTQELEELKALYKDKDFADLTKELVLSRHTAAIDFAQRGLALAQKGFGNKRDFELPQKEAGLAQKLEKSERALRETKARQEKGKQETELKNKKTEHELDELEAEIKKLEDKLKAADKPADKPAEKPVEPKKEEKK
jgi:predicted RNase H-like nuclease (RuvC/YqgF family)